MVCLKIFAGFPTLNMNPPQGLQNLKGCDVHARGLFPFQAVHQPARPLSSRYSHTQKAANFLFIIIILFSANPRMRSWGEGFIYHAALVHMY